MANGGVDPDQIDPALQIDSMVEFQINGKLFYGVIKWIGTNKNSKKRPKELVAGLEMENDEISGCSDGKYGGKQCFTSPSNRAFFIPLKHCRPDSRFISSQPIISKNLVQSIEEPISPTDFFNGSFLGRDKGIQGHHNSCYMDATLYAMFAHCDALDGILWRQRRPEDIEQYNKVRRLLRNEIVNPLRRHGFVDYRSVMRLRTYLNELENISGFLDKEKDPEEFIVLLFEKVLSVEPFIKLKYTNNHVETSHLYQLFVEKDERIVLPSVQYLLEYSFMKSNLQLVEVPSVLILQMPRFGQEKLYKRIQVHSELNVSNILAGVNHPCIVCGRTATGYCRDCMCLFGSEMIYTYLCESCLSPWHDHPERQHPKLSESFLLCQENTHEFKCDNSTLQLFAVVCIERSHYISFVKHESADKDSWLFFDSMADQCGGQDGYNIPEVVKVDLLNNLLKRESRNAVSVLDKKDNERVLRLFEDASLCFYKRKSLMYV